jgi:short-subunit dehydrogenase
MNKTIIIIGASSGIGRELSEQYLRKGYRLGILARRTDLLNEIALQAPDRVVVGTVDVSQTDKAISEYENFLSKFDKIDLIINSAGIGFVNHDLDLDLELKTNRVNVDGFVAVTVASIKHLIKQGYGHYAGITSVGALTGRADCPAYNASKAYQANYLEAMRQVVYRKKLPIVVTDIKPGFVDTGMAKGDKLIWMASTTKAARQIIRALENKREHVYVTRRWRLIAWAIKIAPRFVRKIS